jgi:uncharacterized protein YndB with AHSA1/START domain
VLQPEPVCLLIADISGYTEYLSTVEIDHAQDILADLIGTVVTSLRPTFRLAKLEGDAAFCFAPAEKVDGSMLLDTIERCYFSFRRRRRDVRQATSCECNACTRIPTLNLKFVAHKGVVIRQKVAGREELLGSDVIIVHRLLKNDIVESLGISAYAALTEALTSATGIDPARLGMTRHLQAYEHIGEVPIWVLDLEKRWQEEDARQRVFVNATDALISIDFDVPAPPQVVWEFATQPGRRAGWQAANGVTGIDQEVGAGGRRGVGTVNHCMHGPTVILEQIQDWRPYDYFTYLTRLPGNGPVFPTTFEFEPTVSGTAVHMRVGSPKRKADRAILAQVGQGWAAAMQAGMEVLREQAGAETEARTGGIAQPDLPRARNADGFLAGVTPLEIVG